MELFPTHLVTTPLLEVHGQCVIGGILELISANPGRDGVLLPHLGTWEHSCSSNSGQSSVGTGRGLPLPVPQFPDTIQFFNAKATVP